jgi:hypothetical protein
MLPKARVLYCSATGVTDVKNMVRFKKIMFYKGVYMYCVFLADNKCKSKK